MNNSERAWGVARYAYLVVGLLLCVATIESFVQPGPVSPFLYAVAAALTVGGAVFATDEQLHWFNRLFWLRKWK